MKYRFFLVTALILGLLQGPLLPGVFLEGFFLVLLLVLQLEEKVFLSPRAIFVIFAFGLLLDLLQGRHLGATSLIFLGYSVLAYLAGREVFSRNSVILGVLAGILILIRGQVIYGQIFWVPMVFSFFITFCFFKFFFRQPVSGFRLGS